MSTVTMNYSEVVPVRRMPSLGMILILSSLVVLATTILSFMISVSSADLTHRTVVSQNTAAPIAIPVPTPASTEMQPVPSATPASQTEKVSEPSVVPVPVPTPPSQ